MLVAGPSGGGAVELARMFQKTIGNQATLRYLTQRLSNLPVNTPGGGSGERHRGYSLHRGTGYHLLVQRAFAPAAQAGSSRMNWRTQFSSTRSCKTAAHHLEPR